MQNQLLLLEDVGKLGRKGDLVTAKPGFVRNYLLPQKKAVIATKHALKLRAKLQEERLKQAAEDKKESEAIAKVIEGKKLKTKVKVDPTGHMYGSVSVKDIAAIFEKEGIEMDKNYIQLPQPIKKTGEHRIELMLKEGVPTHVFLEIEGEGQRKPAKEAEKKAEKQEAVEEPKDGDSNEEAE